MAKFKIEVPNRIYAGVTEGVAFVEGKAETDDEQVAKVLEKDYGYKVTKAEEKSAPKPKTSSTTSKRKSSAK